MQMPNVFVVPPEEDQSPAWCFFNAAHPALSQIFDQPETPDIHVFSFHDSSLFGTELSVSTDSSITPRNTAETRSIVEALDNGNEDIIYHDVDTDSQYEHDTETGGALSSIHSEPFRATRDAANDSDVVEVFKVMRNRHSSSKEDKPQSVPPSLELKRSKTLKARASKAFCSLKGSLRMSKPRAQDVFASVESDSHHSDIVTATVPNTFPLPPTPSVSRRGSRILSQLFLPPSLKPRSSVASFDQPTHVSQPRRSFVSTSSATDQLSSRSSYYESESLQDDARLNTGSSIPSATTNLKTKNRRFSILSLHKLFSFSSPTLSSPTSLDFDNSSYTTPTLRSTSCTPSSVSTTSGPQTPIYADEGPNESFGPVSVTSETLNLGLGLSTDNFSERGSSDEYTPRAQRTFRSSISSEYGTSTSGREEKVTACPPSTSQHEPGDLSFEMRLDSLHFDTLSFDADRFCTTN